jgi:L-amino acid N-acyltransferase YncA
MIRDIQLTDAQAVAAIYNHYIQHTIVTFEEVSIEAQEMENRIRAVTAKFPWLVYEKEGHIVGYAYASEWKTRSAYKHSVETTIYLKTGEESKGIGALLYTTLIEKLKNRNLHAIIGGISLPNVLSVKLHEKLGFEKVAHFKEVGYKFNQWIDVGYWELIIDDEQSAF